MNTKFSSVQSLSCVWLFATPWIAARQASLSITISQSSLKLMSIESVMPSSHLILCRPLLVPPIPPSIRVFPVVMYGCESWTVKAECQRIDAFELWCWRRLLRVPWTARRYNQSILKEIIWLPDMKKWLIGKDSDAGRDWGQEEEWTTEDEMAGWHHWLDGRESEWTLGDGDGQGGLACCDSWGCKELDTTERLN